MGEVDGRALVCVEVERDGTGTKGITWLLGAITVIFLFLGLNS